MKEIRDLGKNNGKGAGESAVEDIWFGINDRLEPIEFLG